METEFRPQPTMRFRNLSFSSDTVSQRCLELINLLFVSNRPRAYRIELWDGSALEPNDKNSIQFTLRFNHPAGFRHFIMARDELSLAIGYITGAYDLEGSIEAMLPIAYELINRSFRVADKAKIAGLLLVLPRYLVSHDGLTLNPKRQGPLHTRERDSAVVRHHYDVSNDFYSLWLDHRMVYSCAYFQKPDEDLNLAQRDKLDYICRKLRLKPGERLLDIGCGWGALVIHAGRYYGVDAVGVTLSAKQRDLATERIERAGLKGKCRVELQDYRDLDDKKRFAKIVSIGMFEHVGRSEFCTYFTKVWRLLEPGGVFLNHAIAQPAAEADYDGPSLIKTLVFPDAELVPLADSIAAAEAAGFEVRDVEDLREHYYLTLKHWVHRLEAQHMTAAAVTDEPTYRLWRLYMAGAARAFAIGELQIYQTLLSKPNAYGQSGLPLTRDDWYRHG